MKSLYRQFEGRGVDSLLHRNLRMCTEEGVFATPFILLTIPGNVFIAALLTNVLGIGESIYGLIVSLPAWANALQIFLVPLFAGRFSSRSLTIAFSLLNVGFWLVLLFVLNRLPLDNPEAVGAVMIVYFAFISLTQSMAGVSWLSWIQEWIPERLRGKYFGRRNRIIGFITVAFVLATGWIFSRYGESMLAFQIILGLTSGFRLLSIYLLTHIYTPWSHPEKMIHEGWTKRFGDLMKESSFRMYLYFAAILAFGFSMVGPFAPVFMTEYLDFSVSRQTHLLILASLASAFSMPLWGRLCDRYGCRPVIIFTGILWMLQGYLWVFLTPSLTWLLYPMWIWGGGLSGGVLLGGFNLVLKLIPQHLKSSGVSLHLAVTSLAAAFAPIFTGWLLTTELLPLAAGDFRYRVLFAIQPTMILASFFILSRVRESGTAEIQSFNGAFRTMRQSLVQNGYLLVGNLTFFRRIRESVSASLHKKDRKP